MVRRVLAQDNVPVRVIGGSASTATIYGVRYQVKDMARSVELNRLGMPGDFRV